GLDGKRIVELDARRIVELDAERFGVDGLDERNVVREDSGLRRGESRVGQRLHESLSRTRRSVLRQDEAWDVSVPVASQGSRLPCFRSRQNPSAVKRGVRAR